MRILMLLFVMSCIFVSNLAYSDEQTQTKPNSPEDLSSKIESWIDDLVSEDYNKQDRAIWRLYKSGEPAVNQLVERLRSINCNPFYGYDEYKSKKCDRIINALATIGKIAHPGILKMLQDKSLSMRAFALDVLYENRKVPVEFMMPIINTIEYNYKDVETREDELELEFVEDYVSEALYRVGYKDLDRFLNYLKNPDKYVRYAVLCSMSEYTIHEEDIPIVINMVLPILHDKFHSNRHYALAILGNINSDDKIKENIKAQDILPLLSDPDEEVRHSAVWLLSVLNCNEIIPEIAKLLKHELPGVRESAAYLLKEKGNSSIVPQLISALFDEDYNVQKEVEQALNELVVSSSIPEIKELLTEDETFYKKVALELLLKLNDRTIIENAEKYFAETYKIREVLAKSIATFKDTEHIPMLIELLNDKYMNVKLMAVWALGEIGGKQHVSSLLKLMENENDDIKAKVVQALCQIGDKSEKVENALRKALESTNNEIVLGAIAAINTLELKNMTDDIKSILPSSKKYENNSIKDIIWAALDTIVKIEGEESLEFLQIYMQDYVYTVTVRKIIDIVKKFDDGTSNDSNPAMGFYIEAIINGDCHFASSALYALGDRVDNQILKLLCEILLNNVSKSKRWLAAEKLADYADKSTLPTLIKGLKDKDNDVRANCVHAIKDIGVKSAGKDLIPLLKDPDYWVRNQTIEALYALDPSNQDENIKTALSDESLRIIELAIEKINEHSKAPERVYAKYFEDSGNDIGKLFAAQELVKRVENHEKYSKHIVSKLNSKDDEIQKIALKCVGKIKNKSVTPMLLKFLEDEEFDNYNLTIQALGEIGDKSAVPKLLEILDDCYRPGSRGSAARALGQIGDTSAFEQLVKSLQEDIDGWIVRSDAAEALGDLGDKRAISYLIKALDDVFTLSGHIIFGVKCAAIIALGKLKATEALDLLREIVKKYENDHYGSCYDMTPSHLAYQAKIAIKQIQSKN